MSKRDVEEFLTTCKIAASLRFSIDWTEDNIETITDLGYTEDDVLDEILDLAVENYSEGPSQDRNGYANDYWIFGIEIGCKEIYIKIKIRNLDDDGNRQLSIFCKSFHYSKRPLIYPYKFDN